MHVTILGSEGFVGKNLSKILESKFDLTCSDILENGSGINYVKSDVRKLDNLKKVLKDTDVIIDLVANSLISSFDQIIENARVNILGLLNILEAARFNNVKKIIFPSASSMIGFTKQNPVPESHPAVPKTAYGVTKLASEHYFRIYKELYGIDFVIFRFFIKLRSIFFHKHVPSYTTFFLIIKNCSLRSYFFFPLLLYRKKIFLI